MALVRNRYDMSFMETIPAECFYCGEQLTFPFVEWRGNERGRTGWLVIGLHRTCATKFAHHLIVDATCYCRIHRPADLLELENAE